MHAYNKKTLYSNKGTNDICEKMDMLYWAYVVSSIINLIQNNIYVINTEFQEEVELIDGNKSQNNSSLRVGVGGLILIGSCLRKQTH